MGFFQETLNYIFYIKCLKEKYNEQLTTNY